jgi:hypothetical protein
MILISLVINAVSFIVAAVCTLTVIRDLQDNYGGGQVLFFRKNDASTLLTWLAQNRLAFHDSWACCRYNLGSNRWFGVSLFCVECRVLPS